MYELARRVTRHGISIKNGDADTYTRSSGWATEILFIV